MDKRAHLTGFALLALLAAFAFRNQTAWRVWPALGMLALSIETLQGFTIMRDPDWLDLLADLSGASAGVVLAWCVASLSRRLRWRVRAAL